jgi:hypothetical protein
MMQTKLPHSILPLLPRQIFFFIFGFVKDCVYWEMVQNSNEVRERTVGATQCITNKTSSTAGEKLNITFKYAHTVNY